MNYLLLPALRRMLLFSLLATFAVAQPAYHSPEVLPDGRVVFRLFAPDAPAVVVKGLRGLAPRPMRKDASGLWSVTVGPLAPDLYGYNFELGGASITDPMNRQRQDWVSSISLVEVRGAEPLLISQQEVPHGVIHRHVLSSSVRGNEVAVQVYTPPGFDPKAADEYPVLYLLHGTGDDEIAWVQVGRANFIADNLLARKQMTPAIIVMPNGHPVPLPDQPRPTEYGALNEAAMERELLSVIVPYIEAHYPVRRDTAGRAVAGLSMGGRHALGIGLNHLDLFGWVGGFSSSVPATGQAERYAGYTRAMAQKSAIPRLLWIGCGQQDYLIEQNLALITWLKINQLPHEWHLTAGAHEWPVWREYLGQYLRKIFR